ncbi:MAG: hypothetical protein DRP71_04195 [Verrucomicrobia bacterium]|nr:MAG: hypothetical protein DRP71_04195 [Verrucomicrobiota bacterium]
MLFETELRLPDLVRVEVESESSLLEFSPEGFWQNHHTSVHVENAADRLHFELRSETKRIERVSFTWKSHLEPGIRFLNDAWERGYGDLEWAGLSPERYFPWYFLANRGSRTWAIGVRTVPSAFCHWSVTARELRLVCDVRSGTRGVDLGSRVLPIATVVMDSGEDGSPFDIASRFCRKMSDPVSLPDDPIIGFNDWYYGHGHNSPETIRRDTHLLVELAPDGPNRPFFMIDAGWQVCGDANGGPWNRGNRIFGDMKKVAEGIRASGARPGIWIRPLRTHERLPETWLRGRDEHGVALDPSVPEVLEYIAEDVERIVEDWGYEMIKHDFTTYEIFGQWGFEMGAGMTGDRTMSFQDESRTTAEIVRSFYEKLRAAAGSSLIDGCNVIGHLASGCIDLQRTGDDTSGYDWVRTRKMGVNTLAFRMPQHRAFFLSDADCVGITKKIPWRLNRQWLEVLAGSGTPLLVSAAPDAVGTEQKKALREAYLLSSHTQAQPVAEPLDWMDNRTPTRWKMGDREVRFDWFAES